MSGLGLPREQPIETMTAVNQRSDTCQLSQVAASAAVSALRYSNGIGLIALFQ